jgi:F-type H+-transporting ATPase subunit gamma
MAGQLKEVRNRIKSVQSTQQITKAMKMVSAAKLRRAQDAIIQMRPYAQKLQEMLSNIVSNIDGGASLNLAEERTIEKVLFIVITSDRGLCGAYNANVVKLTKATIAEKYATQFAKGNVTIWNIGKKGWESLTKSNYKTDATHKDIYLNLNFQNVQAAAQAATKAFENKEFDRVEIIYSQFKNAATQAFVAEQFLPIPKITSKAGAKKSDFIFEPGKDELIAELEKDKAMIYADLEKQQSRVERYKRKNKELEQENMNLRQELEEMKAKKREMLEVWSAIELQISHMQSLY